MYSLGHSQSNEVWGSTQVIARVVGYGVAPRGSLLTVKGVVQHHILSKFECDINRRPTQETRRLLIASPVLEALYPRVLLKPRSFLEI